MATLQGWQIFLIVMAGVLALLFIAYQCISCVGQHVPTRMPKWCKTIPFPSIISSMNIPLPPNAWNVSCWTVLMSETRLLPWKF
jgi:hypothetical protein